MKTIRIILIGLILVGCSPQMRLNRILTKHPYLAKNVDSTFYDTTTVITKDVRLDTIHSINRTDTLIVTKENLTIKTYVHKDSIYVFGNCKSDTIEVVKTITVPTQIFNYQKLTFWQKSKGWLIPILIILGIGFIAVRILKEFKVL